MTQYTVSSGQTLSGTNLSTTYVPNVGFRGGNYIYDSAEVQAGGTLLNAADQMGASVVVDAGGLAANTSITGGSLTVSTGGNITGTALGGFYYNPALPQFNNPYPTALEIYGSANNTTISGGNARIEAGGSANDIIVTSPYVIASE